MIKATIAPTALYDTQNTAMGTATAAPTRKAVTPDASGQSRIAVAAIRNKRGVGLGIDAVEEPIFIQIKRRDECLNITIISPQTAITSRWQSRIRDLYLAAPQLAASTTPAGFNCE
jgi:hypothetical protein